MENLIKPSEYAKELGISRQAVYAKIKKGQLKTTQVDGQIYIIKDAIKEDDSKKSLNKDSKKGVVKIEKLLEAKDETISVLKETINDLKKTNEMIIGTLQSEVELLKEAFGEMKQIYKTQIEHLKRDEKQEENLIEEISFEEREPKEEKKDSWIKLKSFIKSLDLDKSLKKRLKNLIRGHYLRGDSRFKIENDKFYIRKDGDYSDLLEELKVENEKKRV